MKEEAPSAQEDLEVVSETAFEPAAPPEDEGEPVEDTRDPITIKMEEIEVLDAEAVSVGGDTGAIQPHIKANCANLMTSVVSGWSPKARGVARRAARFYPPSVQRTMTMDKPANMAMPATIGTIVPL